MFIMGIFLFFFLHFIILIPPGEPVIGDFVVSPSNPTEGAGLEIFALFKPHKNI